MVQEVKGLNAELELHRLLDLEILENTQIGVEERWSVDWGQECRAILSDRCRHCETTAVDVLMRPEILAGIAGQYRVDLDAIRPEERLIVDGNTGAAVWIHHVLCTRQDGT